MAELQPLDLAQQYCDGNGLCLKRAALGGAWQPIETAPKDGTPLLLFARCQFATASVVVVGWFLAGRGWIESAFAPNRPLGIVPSHWRPMPEFPV